MAGNKKDLILQTSIDLFFAKGFNATSTSEIALKAGVAEGTIFRHFKTKKDILIRVLDCFLEKVATKFVLKPLNDILETNNGIHVKELLKIIILDRLSFMDKNSEMLWILITEMKYHPDLKERVVNNICSKALKIIEDVFDYGYTRGEVRKTDHTTAQTIFLGLVISIILQYKIFPEIMPSSKTMEESINNALDLLFDGILVNNFDE